MVAVVSSSKRFRIRECRLLEFIGQPRVDRDKGIVYSVRIIGPVSENKRKYLRDAVEAALPLYEGRVVNLDHPERPDKTRSANDPRAWLENAVMCEDGGAMADLHFLNPTEDLAQRVMTAAEQNPRIYGLSHNAEGRGHVDADGVFIVEEITEVRSVDLVTDPATTRGLFEHTGGVMLTYRKFLEAVLPRTKGDKKRPKAHAALKKLLEDKPATDDLLDGSMCEDDMMPDEGTDWRKSLSDVVGQLIQGDDPKAHEMANKILRMVKPEAPVEEDEGAEDDDEEPEMTEGEDEEEEKKKTEESRKVRRKLAPSLRELREQVQKLTEDNVQMKSDKDAAELRSFIRAEVDRRKIPFTEKLSEGLVKIADRKAISTHLDELKSLRSDRQLPYSQARGVVTPVQESVSAVKDDDSFVAALAQLSLVE